MDLSVSLLNFNFAITYIIHKILVLIKNHLNYLKDNIFEFYFWKKLSFFTIYNDGKPQVWRRKIIKDVRNRFRLKEIN